MGVGGNTMTEHLELYKCDVCGNVIEVLVPGIGELVCCGEPMEQMEVKTKDSEFGEKHVPVITHLDSGETEIRVGSVLHPMEEKHYIQFIQTISADKKFTQTKFLSPGEEPVMKTKTEEITKARELCNIHGVWSTAD